MATPRNTLLHLTGLLLVGCVVSCRQRVDSTTEHTTLPKSAASDTTARSVGSSAPSVDSSALDYPIGYYFPSKPIEQSGYKIAWIALPEGNVTLTRTNGGGNSNYDCLTPLTTRDTVDVQCPHTPIGSIHFAGAFTAIISNWKNIDLQDKVILVGVVTVARNDTTLFSRRVEFTYWQGD